MVAEVGTLIRQARRYGRLELEDGRVLVEGRFPKALIETLRARKEEVRQALRGPDVAPLVDSTSRLADVPTVRFTVGETEDVGGDTAFLRRLRSVLDKHPGGNLVVMTIRTLDGHRVRAEWRALADPILRRRLAELLRERAEALGLLVDRCAGTCRRCGGADLASASGTQLFCRACVPRGGSS